jgi:hypothetical protein
MIVINLVAPKAGAKRELLFNKPAFGHFVGYCCGQLWQHIFLVMSGSVKLHGKSIGPMLRSFSWSGLLAR